MPPNEPQLRDIHLPHVSMWWPLAPGWWVLAALVVAAVVILVVMIRRRRAWRRYVDGVLADVRTAARDAGNGGDASAFASTASQLLRRVARTRDPRSVAVSGDAWLAVLSTLAPKQDVTRLGALDTVMYQRSAPIDIDATLRDVEAWVRTALKRRSRVHAPS